MNTIRKLIKCFSGFNYIVFTYTTCRVLVYNQYLPLYDHCMVVILICVKWFHSVTVWQYNSITMYWQWSSCASIILALYSGNVMGFLWCFLFSNIMIIKVIFNHLTVIICGPGIVPLFHNCIHICGWHGGSVVSTVALQCWGPGFKTHQGQHLHGVCMLSLCLCGFPPCTPVSPTLQKHTDRLIWIQIVSPKGDRD